MAFPIAPTNGTTYTIGTVQYVYNSTTDTWSANSAISMSGSLLGAAASNPGNRTDGSALQEGDIYYNTATDTLMTYNNTTWSAVGTHADTSTLNGVQTTANNVINSITVDSNGHVTAVGTTLAHADTSTLNGVQTTAGQFVNSITVDSNGHVTAVGTAAAPAPTAATVGTAIAGMAAGDVGTYAWLVLNTNTNTDYVPGATFAGANLRWSGFESQPSGSAVIRLNGTSPAGTWRALGVLENTDNSGGAGQQRQGSTLFVRIA